MKKIIVLLFCISLSINALAHDSTVFCIKIAPIVLPIKFRMDIEHTLSNTLSIGSNFQYYSYLRKGIDNGGFLFKGYKLELYGRVYLEQNAPLGTYLQLVGGYGQYYYDSYSGNINYKGAALAIGRQRVALGGKGILDMGVAFQLYDPNWPPTDDHMLDVIMWLVGQGAIIAPKFALGFTF